MPGSWSRFAACLGLALASACGGDKGKIEIDVVTSPIDNVFASATQVVFTVGPKSTTAPVINGHYDISLDQEPPKDPGTITIRALDAAGNTVGYGTTPTLQLKAIDQGPFTVWVGRPGTIAAAVAKLPTPRAEIAAFGASGLGGMFAGGRDATGALKSSALYNVYTQGIIVVTDLTSPRAGAVAIANASSPHGTVFGGAQSGPLGAPTGALASGELFDPSTGSGIWAAVPSDAAPEARAFANILTIGTGSGLVSGGLSGSGAPLSSAMLVAAGGTARLTPLASTMAAHRFRHCGAQARFPAGDGALIVGGVADGDPGPVLEQFVGQSFSTFDVAGIENRWDATATAVSGGILLVGGTVPNGGTRAAVKSVVFIPTEVPGPAIRYDGLLSSARAGHTATLLGQDLLVCGGVDETGAALASCDLVNTNPVGLRSRIPTGVARTGHVAVTLETGPVLIAGGIGASGELLDSIEIYTPPAPAQ